MNAKQNQMLRLPAFFRVYSRVSRASLLSSFASSRLCVKN